MEQTTEKKKIEVRPSYLFGSELNRSICSEMRMQMIVRHPEMAAEINREFTRHDAQLALLEGYIDKMLSTPPKGGKDSPIQTHPYGRFEYLPITYLVSLLNQVFGGFEWQVVSESLASHHVEIKGKKEPQTISQVAGILKVTHPTKGILTFGGVGSDFVEKNQKPNMVGGLADTAAFKNACQKIGKAFGYGLRRDDNKTKLSTKHAHRAAAQGNQIKKAFTEKIRLDD